MSADCRIRRLTIRTDDRATVPRISFLLEDALRTASLPGIPPNGHVLIKKLDLGNFPQAVNRPSLSNRIDTLLRYATPVKIDSAAADQPHADFVWFADELEPYRLLTQLLAAGHRPVAWYWAVAVPGWSPRLTIPQSMQQVISHAVQKKTGLVGVAHILEPLLIRGMLLEVIDTFAPILVANWLLTVGLIAEMVDGLLVDGSGGSKDNTGAGQKHRKRHVLPEAWENLLKRACRLWPVSDARTVFIAHLGIARSRQPTTPVRAREMIWETLQRIESPQQPGSDLNRNANLGSDKDSQPPESHRFPSSTFESKTGSPVLTNPRLDPSDISKEGPPGSSRTNRQKIDHISNERDREAARPANKQPPRPEPRRLPGRYAGEVSEYAGLACLIAVLKRLGIETLLADDPEYTELQMASRVFGRIALLLHIPKEDPIQALFSQPPVRVSPRLEFTAPRQWLCLVPPDKADSARLSLARVSGLPGARLIMDPSTRLVLGCWHSGSKARIKPWLESATALDVLDRPRRWNLDKAVDNWIRAICRYLRRYTELNLSTLIRRPAHVSVTRTHMDITMPLRQIDTRVRLAGLDIDPGWVFWLGRVIRFHYTEDAS